jgi:undecaprenyl-diphosphatase
MFSDIHVVGWGLIITGALLSLTRGSRDRGVSFTDAFLTGIVQGIAVTPGISRSGATISLLLLRGIRRRDAVRFSFLLSIPAVLGAVLIQSELFKQVPSYPSLFVGFATSLSFGYLAAQLLKATILRGVFRHFAWYCLPTGVVLLLI